MGELQELARINPHIVRSPALRTSRSTVLAAVQMDGTALQYAAPEIKSEPDIVKEAMGENRMSFFMAHPCLREDEELKWLTRPGMHPPGSPQWQARRPFQRPVDACPAPEVPAQAEATPEQDGEQAEA